ncbi:MAG: universal stress protein [Pseudonocardia sp.]|nr:universal stress protein [Pseudonocardia sp.]
MTSSRPVVVGVDGSGAALTAVQFAASRAAGRSVPLVLLHAVSAREDPRQEELLLARATALATDTAPGVEVVRRHSAWAPLGALTAASLEAGLLVVGMAGRDDPPEAGGESVALDLLEVTACPLAVVREPQRRHRAVVTAALTDPALGTRVLAEAIALAEDLDVPVVVRVVRDPHGAPRAADGALADVLAPWRGRFPGITLEPIDAAVSPERLLDAAEGSRALVLAGPDGPPRWDHLARRAVHRGPCPVVVVPTDRARPGTGSHPAPDHARPRAHSPGGQP